MEWEGSPSSCVRRVGREMRGKGGPGQAVYMAGELPESDSTAREARGQEQARVRCGWAGLGWASCEQGEEQREGALTANEAGGGVRGTV